MRYLFFIFLFLPLFPQVVHPAENHSLDKVLENLAWCESRNKVTAYKAHDPIMPSFGLFQYKKDSWNYFIDKYGLFPNTEKQERMNLIWDRYSQEVVTKVVLLSERNPQKYWRNCLRNVL